MARQTSVDSFNQIKDGKLLSDRRMNIYEILFHNGPLTSNEIFEKVDGSSSINNPNIHSRLNELREFGCVSEVGTKKCSLTGMTVILWDVTPNLPVKLSEKEKLVRQITSQESKLLKLKGRLSKLEA